MASQNEIDELKRELELLRRQVGGRVAALEERIASLEGAGKAGATASEPEVEVPEIKLNRWKEPVEAVVDVEVSEMATASRSLTELDFGRIWAVRGGVVLLLIGLVFLGNYAYQNWIRDLGSEVRWIALTIAGVAITFIGARTSRREEFTKWGQAIMACGGGFLYYLSYAAHHVPNLQIVESLAVGVALNFAFAVLVVGYAIFRGSEVLATLGVFLSLLALFLGRGAGLVGELAVLGGMAAAMTFFSLKKGWKAPLSTNLLPLWIVLASVLGSATATAQWQTAAPLVLWILTSLGFAQSKLDDPSPKKAVLSSVYFGLHSAIALFLQVVVGMEIVRPKIRIDDLWFCPAIMSVCCLAFAKWGSRYLRSSFIGLSVTLTTTALLFAYDSYSLGIALALQSVVMAVFYLRHRKALMSLAVVILSLMSCFLVGDELVGLLLSVGGVFKWPLLLQALLLLGALLMLEKGKDSPLRIFFQAIIAMVPIFVLIEGYWSADAPILTPTVLTAMVLATSLFRRGKFGERSAVGLLHALAAIGILSGAPLVRYGVSGMGHVVYAAGVSFLLIPALASQKREVIGQQASLILVTLLFLMNVAVCLSNYRLWDTVVVVSAAIGLMLTLLGLWREKLILRQIGCVVFLIGLVRLFFVDVWKFDSFQRILAFVALGVALIAVGYFYNRIAAVLKPEPSGTE